MKTFREKISGLLNEDVKILLSDWMIKLKFIILDSSFRALKDVNSSTHDFVNSVLDTENKKLAEKVGEKDKIKGE
jgi:hypothetical protein